MDNNNIKTYLIISGVIIFIFLYLIIAPLTRRKITSSDNQVDNQPTPTLVVLDSYYNNNQRLTPTPKPAEFTGVYDEGIAQDTINASQQKQDLRKITPISTDFFTVEFSYEQDRFIVTLNEPKDTNKEEFYAWKDINYPLIDNQQFNFK